MENKVNKRIIIFGLLYLAIGLADLIGGSSTDSRFYPLDNAFIRFIGLILTISSIGLFLKKEIARKGIIVALILSLVEIFIGVPLEINSLEVGIGIILMLLLYVPGLIYFSGYKQKEYFSGDKKIGFFNLKISRSFVIPTLDEVIKNRIINYWGNRNAQFTKITDTEFHATRGSLLSNLTALNMSKLKTTIDISISENNQLTCTLNINTMFQQITNWNREYWDLELETFQSFLHEDNLREQEWIALTKKSRIKNIFGGLIVVIISVLIFYGTTNILQNDALIPQFKQFFDQESVKADKTFTSEDGSLQLVASDDWKTNNTLNEQAMLQIANLAKDKYLIIIDESKIDFADNTTISDYASLVIEGLEGTAENVSVSEPTEVTINNNPALQYEFHGEVDKVKISFNVTVIKTPDSFYQVLAWSLQSSFDEHKEEFKSIISTFKGFGSKPVLTLS